MDDDITIRRKSDRRRVPRDEGGDRYPVQSSSLPVAPPSGRVYSGLRPGASTPGFTSPPWPTVYTFHATCQVGHSTAQRFTEAQVRAGVLPFTCGVCTSRWTSSRDEEAGMLHRIVLGELNSRD